MTLLTVALLLLAAYFIIGAATGLIAKSWYAVGAVFIVAAGLQAVLS